jgi:hypothetical protein
MHANPHPLLLGYSERLVSFLLFLQCAVLGLGLFLLLLLLLLAG